jgi:hypothetical protein
MSIGAEILYKFMHFYNVNEKNLLPWTPLIRNEFTMTNRTEMLPLTKKQLEKKVEETKKRERNTEDI